MKLPVANEIRKPSKTLAGVTPIAVMAKPRKCKHGTCLYCPSLDVPQSYTPKSPPVLRALRLNYDPYLQVLSRLKAFQLMNHPTSKIELIIMGGNFLDYPIKYQNQFVKGVYDSLNNKKSKNLEDAMKKNEKAKHRCVALCIESRPDTILKKGVIERILRFGCTRVEIGVQCLDDKIYKFVNRGHFVKEVISATRLLKESGFKVGYHMMLGLPLSNPFKDLTMFKKLFSDENFKPDQLKIYPTQVIVGSGLSKLYEKNKYKPYTKEEIEKLLIKIFKIIPNYCRIMRVMREIPPEYLISGTTRIDLRKDIEEELRNKISTKEINEIRYREIGFAYRDGIKINNKLRLKTTEYDSSKGKEYFLEFINKDNILFGLLRLRINSNEETGFVREVHVYGQALKIGEKGKSFGQHLGLGKKLMKKAEDVCKKEKIKVLKVISGVGVREYYKKLGYKLDKEKIYMIKEI
ncbi:MAG: tRNA uridine(34) 5-carboxymethylaminomethyl modification radical SAM/GNAT enzyme Elp3 [Nanoarchaeota archaeon]|nr:tRNA uridine(34) 5-carboxymethylaminomethyl modification radical SAM/GNAT enzyme Elp3 [Nanoarchaeota archaeon]